PTVRPRSFADVRRGQKPHCGLFVQGDGPNLVWVGGVVALGDVARLLGSPLGLGSVQVLDRTGSTETFNFILEFAADENIPGQVIIPRLRQPAPPDVPRAPTIAIALESQFGLTLQPSRAPREFIVVDRVVRPSPN